MVLRNLSYYLKPNTIKNVERIKELAHIRYGNRLKNVKSYCKEKGLKIPKVERNNAADLATRWREEMWWDIKNGFAWCCVYKGCSRNSYNFLKIFLRPISILNYVYSRVFFERVVLVLNYC